jgi:hypothetical protein
VALCVEFAKTAGALAALARPRFWQSPYSLEHVSWLLLSLA